MPKYVHLLGKDARRQIIARLATTKGVRRLAKELGVTPAAISKYLRGETHPSDRVIEKALEIMDSDDAAEISRIIAEELLAGVESYVRWASERGIVDPRLVSRLSDLAAKAGLVTLSSKRSEEVLSSQEA